MLMSLAVLGIFAAIGIAIWASSASGYARPLQSPSPFPGNQPQLGGPYFCAGAPIAGTSCVQTLTTGGTPTGGSFTLFFNGETTGGIAWSATDATFEANIAAGLNALNSIGSSGVAVTAGNGSSGIGTYLITFQNQNANESLPVITVAGSQLIGTSPTVAVAMTTAGVTGTLRGSITGTKICDYTGPYIYTNVGTKYAPSWVRSDVNIGVLTLTGVTATTGGAVGSWFPPEGGPVIIVGGVAYVTTVSSGAANLTLGIGSTSTTSDNGLLTATDVHSATGVFVTTTPTKLLPAGYFVTATGSADTSGLVGKAFIRYIKP